MKQDAKGTIWSVGKKLQVLEDEWKPRTLWFPATESTIAQVASFPWLLPLLFEAGTPMKLAPMPDGGMACVWKLSGERMAVTSHRSKDSRLHGICSGEIPNSGLRAPVFADSQNRIWVTNETPDIYRTDARGKLGVVYSVPRDQLIPETCEGRLCSFFVTEDGKGREWVWSNSRMGGMTGAALNGVLLFDGGKLHLHNKFEGIQSRRFSFIGPKDEKHMWVAAVKEGVFSVNIATWAATPLVEPEPGAFHWVQKIFSAGDDLYIIAGRQNETHRSSVWRRRAGKWTLLIDHADTHGHFTLDHNRGWLRFGADVVLNAFDAEPWIIRGDGHVERLDWSRGFALEDARHFYELPNGTFFASGKGGQTFLGLVDVTSPVPPARVHEIYFAHHGWATDAAGHVWAVFAETPNILNKWDGKEWTPYSIPTEMRMRFLGVAIDQFGRVWLLPKDAQSAFLDPASGEWRLFPTFENALAELKTDAPEFLGKRPQFCAPDYSADRRRIAYRALDWKVHYFDGTTWHHWSRDTITGRKIQNQFTIGMPFFDQMDRLCVSIGKETWIRDVDGRWQQGETDVKFADDPNRQLPKQELRLPRECQVSSPESVVVDNQGATWITSQGKLYKCGFGKLVEVFSEGEPNPFTYGRMLREAWVDPVGTTFLRTDADKQIMILPRSPLLPASLVIEKPAPDSVIARFEPAPGGTSSYRWKLDDGPWRTTAEATLTLDSLIAGAHTLTASVVSEELQVGAPATVEFNIDIDPQEQLRLFIARLADRDYTRREAAVAALSQQPELALPPLKNARLEASLDLRWWIDLAIQESERNLRAKK
ncbi:MAG TPA: hypothetical protein VF585_05385 [Chthoniobacterales bacterium]